MQGLTQLLPLWLIQNLPWREGNRGNPPSPHHLLWAAEVEGPAKDLGDGASGRASPALGGCTIPWKMGLGQIFFLYPPDKSPELWGI